MQELWEALSTFEKIFWYIAIPFSVILLIQLVLTFVGMDGGSSDIGDVDTDVPDIDVDTEADGVFNHDDGLHAGDGVPQFGIFTIRNFIAFFTIFGWAGIAGNRADLNTAWVIIIATVLGVLAMLIISALFYFISKLADSGGALDMRNAVNKIGTVYLPINAKSGNIGKIQIMVQDSLHELKALTKQDEDLSTGTVVKVIGLASSNVLIVEKFTK
ncbi:MAG: hypothetical protein HN600_00400 [Bacteroidetes bacterium]|nr:hypothetical protein [Bacteroidota bacterium]